MKIVNKTGYLKGAKTAKNPVNIIPSNLITTQGMAFPIKANGKTLYPNTGQYKFPTPYVVETPLKQNGSSAVKSFLSAINPKNWGVTDYSNKKDFNSAYSSAKKAGKEEFMWNGKRYNTKYAGTPRQEIGAYGAQGKPVNTKYIDEPSRVNLYPPLGKYEPGHIAASPETRNYSGSSVDYRPEGNKLGGLSSVNKDKGEKTFYVYNNNKTLLSNKAESLPTGKFSGNRKPSDWNLFTNNCADNVCDAFGIPRSKGIQTPSGAMSKIKEKYPTLDVTGRTYEDYENLYYEMQNQSNEKVLSQAKNIIGIASSPEIKHTDLGYKLISNIQGILEQEGYKLPKSIRKEDLTYDGIFGDETKAALEDYLKKKSKKISKKQDGVDELNLLDRASDAAKFTYRIKDKKRRDTQVADMYNNALDSFRGDTTNAKRHFKSFFTDYGSERFDGVRPLEGYYGFDRKDYDDKTLDSLGRDWHKKMKVSKKDNGVKGAKVVKKTKTFNFNPNTSLSTDNTANIQGREVAKVDKFKVQKTKDYNAAQAAGGRYGEPSEEKFYSRYGQSSNEFKYETDPRHRAQIDKKIKEAEKAGRPMLRENVKLDPNAMFMLPIGLKGQAAKDYQDFHKEIIQSALPIPGLDKMSGLGKINKLESTLLPAAKKTSSTLNIASSIKNIPNYLTNTLNLTDEALGRLFRNKGNKEAISKGNQWLENWIKHPKTQAKIDADLDNALAARNKVFDRDIALTRRQSKGYVPSVKEYSLEKQLDDLVKGKEHIHSGNIGVSYTHDTSPYWRDQIATGTYKPTQRYGDWMSRSLSIPQKKRVSTSIHEGTHGWATDKTLEISGMRDRVLKEMPEDVKKNFLQWESLNHQHINPEKVMGQTKAYEGYISDPTEMHARVMQIREHFNLTPDDVIDTKRAKNLIRRLEEMPYHRRPVDIDAMSKTIGNNPESFANLMNNMWAVPAVGAAGVAASSSQKQRNGNKNVKPIIKYKNGSKSVSLAFSRGEKDPKGGLTQKGVDKYNRATGGNLKMAVTTPPSKLKPGSKAANRRKSFCARMSGVKGPMMKNGKPTRKALALRKWNC